MSGWSILEGDALLRLRGLAAESVQCCVTSPPYWGMRDYGVECQLGLERTPQEYIEKMVSVFREVRRVLRSDGTLWLNMGDSYAAGGNGGHHKNETFHGHNDRDGDMTGRRKIAPAGLKPKDLVMMPARLALALQSDGWYLRQDIIWSKPNPMPESVRDRCTKAHEYLFLLSRSERYFYSFDAMQEQVTGGAHARGNGVNPKAGKWKTPDGMRPRQNESFSAAVNELVDSRNRRSVWTIPTEACPEAHFATFPTALVEPCILAGSREGDMVLDPFSGSGTTGLVALRYGRRYLGIELNPGYVEMSRRRILADNPLFNQEKATGSEKG